MVFLSLVFVENRPKSIRFFYLITDYLSNWVHNLQASFNPFTRYKQLITYLLVFQLLLSLIEFLPVPPKLVHVNFHTMIFCLPFFFFSWVKILLFLPRPGWVKYYIFMICHKYGFFLLWSLTIFAVALWKHKKGLLCFEFLYFILKHPFEQIGWSQSLYTANYCFVFVFFLLSLS